jgi:hypothetical protein
VFLGILVQLFVTTWWLEYILTIQYMYLVSTYLVATKCLTVLSTYVVTTYTFPTYLGKIFAHLHLGKV